MIKANKLPSGNWRCRVLEYTDNDGKRHYKSFTATSKAVAESLAAEFMANHKPGDKRDSSRDGWTVGEAVDRYIELSQDALSPTTIARYRKMREFGFPQLMDMPVADVTNEIMQNAINEEIRRPSARTGKPLSAKTVSNEWGLIATAFNTLYQKTFNIKLPKRRTRNIEEFPSPERVLEAVVGTDIELPCLLALWLSFSMSEIRGLKCSSVRDGYIYVDQVMVDVDGAPVVKKNAKVDTRVRKLKIPPYLLSLMENTESYKTFVTDGVDGFLVPQTRASIAHKFDRIMRAADISISFHGLRHINASLMLALNIPEKYAMERGGWKTPNVMKNVYQHTLSDERLRVDAAIDGWFDEKLSGVKNP